MKKIDLTALDDFKRGQGYVISIANSKGGVGKTTISNMLAYNYAKLGLKTLIIDADKQGNSTKTMFVTKQYHSGEDTEIEMNKTFMQGLIDNDLQGSVVPIMENLDLIPSGKDTENFARHIYLNIDNDIDRDFFLQDAIRNVQFFYDVVIIDSPPNNADLVKNISLASDYIIVAYQPAESSTTGAEDFKQEIDELRQSEFYEAQLNILGVLPSMVKRDSRTDNYYVHYIKHESPYFSEEDVFKNIIYLKERLKAFDITGIKEEDFWDTDSVELFEAVAIEALERMVEIELNEGVVEE